MCMRQSVPEYDEEKISPEDDDDPPIVIENVHSDGTPVKTNPKKMEAMGVEMDDMKKISNNLTAIREKMEDKEKDDEIAAEWRGVASVVDRFLFWMCLLIVVVLMTAILAQRDSNH